MITPQQIDQISFKKATFGGYDMEQVDEFLEPLTEDYVTLYKENALLKSKMRVLVGKLEEYRKNEASLKEAVANAQKTCDQMVLEAQEKCNAMLKDASNSAAAATDTDALVAAEAERVQEARKLASAKIEEIQNQMRSCIQALDRIKLANRPANPGVTPYNYDKAESAPKQDNTEAMANEIAMNLEALVGTAEEPAPNVEPMHPVSDTTSKFANLQFGRNYDPNNR